MKQILIITTIATCLTLTTYATPVTVTTGQYHAVIDNAAPITTQTQALQNQLHAEGFKNIQAVSINQSCGICVDETAKTHKDSHIVTLSSSSSFPTYTCESC